MTGVELGVDVWWRIWIMRIEPLCYDQLSAAPYECGVKCCSTGVHMSMSRQVRGRVYRAEEEAHACDQHTKDATWILDVQASYF